MRRARSIACGCLEIYEFANERPLLLLGSTSKNAIRRAFLRMNEISGVPDSEKVLLVSQLLEAGKTDTVYRDLYLERAHVILGALLPYSEYLRLKHSKVDIDDLLRQVAPALERQEWVKVKELTGRIRVLRQAVEEKHALAELAGKIYEPIDVPFNPFDRGLQAVLAFSKQEPARLRDSMVVTLATLEKEDPVWRNFYSRRRAYFQGLTLTPLKLDKLDNTIENLDRVQIQKQARRALESRDINSLERLAEEMLRTKSLVEGETVRRELVARSIKDGEDPSFIFSEKTLSAAAPVPISPGAGRVLSGVW